MGDTRVMGDTRAALSCTAGCRRVPLGTASGRPPPEVQGGRRPRHLGRSDPRGGRHVEGDGGGLGWGRHGGVSLIALPGMYIVGT